ncbi:hypothetical protein NMY22_g14341 [Coprinellus aureogranulatus]|nr:hypothetical protein NMY22_g14341 [Coprinellus aureogranulatus]
MIGGPRRRSRSTSRGKLTRKTPSEDVAAEHSYRVAVGICGRSRHTNALSSSIQSQTQREVLEQDKPPDRRTPYSTGDPPFVFRIRQLMPNRGRHRAAKRWGFEYAWAIDVEQDGAMDGVELIVDDGEEEGSERAERWEFMAAGEG